MSKSGKTFTRQIRYSRTHSLSGFRGDCCEGWSVVAGVGEGYGSGRPTVVLTGTHWTYSSICTVCIRVDCYVKQPQRFHGLTQGKLISHLGTAQPKCPSWLSPRGSSPGGFSETPAAPLSWFCLSAGPLEYLVFCWREALVCRKVAYLTSVPLHRLELVTWFHLTSHNKLRHRELTLSVMKTLRRCPLWLLMTHFPTMTVHVTNLSVPWEE